MARSQLPAGPGSGRPPRPLLRNHRDQDREDLSVSGRGAGRRPGRVLPAAQVSPAPPTTSGQPTSHGPQQGPAALFTIRAFGVPREPRICRCRRWRIGSARRLSKGPQCQASAVARPPGAAWLGGAWPSPRNSPETSPGTCAGASALCWHRLRAVCSPHVTRPRPARHAHLDRALLCPPPAPCRPPSAAGAGRRCRVSGASPEGVGPSSCSPQQRPGPGRSRWWPELAGGPLNTRVYTHAHTLRPRLRPSSAVTGGGCA